MVRHDHHHSISTNQLVMHVPRSVPSMSYRMDVLCVVRCRKKRLGLGLVGLGADLTTDLDALQYGLSVLVKLELVDDDVGGVDAERDALARDLLAGDALDVDHVLETVDGGDLALAALVAAADNGDLVVLSDGDAADLYGEARMSVGWWGGGSGMLWQNLRCTSHGAPCSEGRS
jgi:hypothetical protein